MVVFGSNYGAGYGHVAWVIEATLDYIIVYEQNWLGGGWTDEIEQPGWGWEKLQDDNMLTISYVVYPPELQKRNSTTISSISYTST